MFIVEQLYDAPHFVEYFLSKYVYLEPKFTIWGNIPKDAQSVLSNSIIKENLLRRFLFHEYCYRINKGNLNDVISIFPQINFKKIAWGISFKDSPVILAKSNNDITICCGEILSKNELGDLLKKMEEKNILKGYSSFAKRDGRGDIL
jgi:hypothetical protein